MFSTNCYCKIFVHITATIFMTLITFQPIKAQPNPLGYIYVIDSVQMKRGLWSFLPSSNIKDIKVVKNDPHYRQDVIFMTLKDHDAFFQKISSKFLSPDMIARKYIPNYSKNTQVIFIWNDKLLIDTADMGIPERYFRKAEITRTAKTAYAKTLPKAIILNIYTKEP